jgi:hypothetical protein
MQYQVRAQPPPQIVTVAPVTSVDRWHQPLSQPVLTKKEGGDCLAMSLSQDRETTTIDRWWQQLSLPLRRTWSPASYPFVARSTVTPPPAATINFGWYQPFRDPFRLGY